MSYFGGYFGDEDPEEEAVVTPPTPIPSPVATTAPEYRDFTKQALNRLPLQFRDPDV